MFGMKRTEKKDPAEIAKEFAKANDVELDESLAPVGSDSSAEKKQVDSDEIKDDKPSQEEDGTPKDGKQDEDKDDQLTEEEQKLIDTPDDDLDDDTKTKKALIVKKKGDTKAEKRIGDLISTVKELESKMNDRDNEWKVKLAEMEAEKKALENKTVPENVDNVLATKESERLNKYISEDQTKPREEKREMTKDEIEEWLVDDYSSANDWLNRRYDRRKTERQQDRSAIDMESKIGTIVQEQDISRIRMEARHPELKIPTINARKKALHDEGKSPKEVEETIIAESPKYKAMSELLQDRALIEKLSIEPDFPELLEQEMLKKLDNPSKSNSETEELKTRIAELEDLVRAKELRGDPVGVGAGSRSKGGKMRNDAKHNPALEAELAKLKKKGYDMTVQDYADMIERRKGIPGANQYKDDNET